MNGYFPCFTLGLIDDNDVFTLNYTLYKDAGLNILKPAKVTNSAPSSFFETVFNFKVTGPKVFQMLNYKMNGVIDLKILNECIQKTKDNQMISVKDKEEVIKVLRKECLFERRKHFLHSL